MVDRFPNVSRPPINDPVKPPKNRFLFNSRRFHKRKDLKLEVARNLSHFFIMRAAGHYYGHNNVAKELHMLRIAPLCRLLEGSSYILVYKKDCL